MKAASKVLGNGLASGPRLRPNTGLQSRHMSVSPRLGSSLSSTRSTSASTSTSTSSSTSASTSTSTLALAIETSCDDTCVAILEKRGYAARLLFNQRVSLDTQAKGGIVPADATALHSRHLPGLVQKALAALPAGRVPDFVAVTRGPGMASSLATGINVAQGLAIAWAVPFVGVHHMQAHALTPRLVNALQRPWLHVNHDAEGPAADAVTTASPAFPFLSLLVSGGHTMLVRSESLVKHTVVADTVDIALGDMLDKCARHLVPPEAVGTDSGPGSGTGPRYYGAALEAFAFPPGQPNSSEPAPVMYDYNPPLSRADEIAPFEHPRYKWRLTPPLADVREPSKFSFTGLGSAVRRIMFPEELLPRQPRPTRPDGHDGHDSTRPSPPAMDVEEKRALARVTMKLAFEHLASRVIFALESIYGIKGRSHTRAKGRRINTLVVSGGVASNKFLVHVLRAVLTARGFFDVRIVVPPVALCTDNAAMVAWAAMEMWDGGYHTQLGVMARRKWSIDPWTEDGGILGADGWLKRKRNEERPDTARVAVAVAEEEASRDGTGLPGSMQL